VGSLFSSLQSGITTPLVRAGLMPAAVFTVLLGALVVPLLPWARTFLVGLDPSGGDGILVGLGFVTVILAGVLLVVSDLMVRLYEGYYWRHGLLGRLLTSRYRGEFERMTAAVDGDRGPSPEARRWTRRPRRRSGPHSALRSRL
jgi:hypothetical protein